MCNRVSTGLMVAIVILAGAGGAAAQQGKDGWRTSPDIPDSPVAWAYQGAGSAGGRVFMFGGSSPAGATSATYEYDPVTQAWSARRELPGGSPIFGMGYASFAGLLFSIGGADSTAAPMGTVSCYDPASDFWVLRSDMPTARIGLTCAVAGGRIYACGGQTTIRNGSTNLATVEEYDPATDQWRALPSLPSPLVWPFSGGINGRVIVAGGRTATAISPATWELDVVSGATQWVRGPDVPVALRAGASCVRGKRLFCFGGRSPSYSTGSTVNQIYDALSRTWSRGSDLPHPAYFCAAATAGGKAYLAGHPSQPNDMRLQEYSPAAVGSAPEPPTGLLQELSAGTELPPGGWVRDAILLSGLIDDPDDEFLRLEAEVRAMGEAFRNEPNVASPWASKGQRVRLIFALPTGDYRWHARTVDENGNESAWAEYGESDPDFRVDQTPPSTPILRTPAIFEDVDVGKRDSGPVTFTWEPSSDNNGLPVSYVLWILSWTPAGEQVFESQVPGDTSTATVELPTSRYEYYWSVQAVDSPGNRGGWAPAQPFRAVHDDGRDHSAGDAKRACGFSTSAGSPGWPMAAWAASAAAWALLRRLRRSWVRSGVTVDNRLRRIHLGADRPRSSIG